MVPRVLICLDGPSQERLAQLVEATGYSVSALVRALIMATEPPSRPALAPRADWVDRIKENRRKSRASEKEPPCE